MSKYRQVIVDCVIFTVLAALIATAVGYWLCFSRIHFIRTEWTGHILGKENLGDMWLGGRFLQCPARHIRRVEKWTGTWDCEIFFFVELEADPSIAKLQSSRWLHDTAFRAPSSAAESNALRPSWPDWFPAAQSPKGSLKNGSRWTCTIFTDSDERIFLLVSA